MSKPTGDKEKLDSLIESVRSSQRSTVWPDVLRGGRSVDELLWKGRRDAPMVQRIGAVILGVAYLLVGLAFFGMALEQGSWFIAASVPIIFGVGAWFIRNAMRK
jgi:hypothetical protein